jgi:fructan beta-fructosidase
MNVLKRVKRCLCLLMLLLSASVIMAQDNVTYHEPFRPQYHFSPPCRWMNDPNGMVYYEGEYHLFYQLNPLASTPGKMHWGHAVSPDLLHWENLPIALSPDEIGAIWSGSAVVDAANTSGLVPGGGLVAIYSYENQSQGIAWSTDKGRTWTKYAGNPVIPALEKDFRDPKVIWHEASQKWVMIISAGQEVRIFTSPNLIDWEFASSFMDGLVGIIWEVPDLFPLEIDGATKWVMLVSVSRLAPAGGNGIQYFIGDFDGTTFSNDNPGKVLWLDYGQDNYAGTTWDNAPDGKRLYIGWMSNWLYAAQTPTSPWRGAGTLPREFTLVRTAEGIRLQQTSISVETLRQPLGTWDNLPVSGSLPLNEVQGRALEIIAEFDTGNADRFGIDVQRGEGTGTRIVYNAAQEQLLISRGDPGGLNGFNPVFGAPTPLDGKRLHLHLFVDESSVEVLAQDGTVSLSAQTFANPADAGVALFADGGTATVEHLEIYALASVWTGDPAFDGSWCE